MTNRATASHFDSTNHRIEQGDRIAWLQHSVNAPTDKGEGIVRSFDQYGGIYTDGGYVCMDWDYDRKANVPIRSRIRDGEYLHLITPAAFTGRLTRNTQEGIDTFTRTDDPDYAE